MNRLVTIWMLKLVPGGRYGRSLCAAFTLVIGVGAYVSAAAIGEGGFASAQRFGSFPVAAFFVAAVAYIVPVFHYITSRAEVAIDALTPYLKTDRADNLKSQLRRKPLSWIVRVSVISVAMWLVQSRLLAGSWERMWDAFTAGLFSALMSVGPLPVWLTMNIAMSALFNNAILFRRLSRDLDVQILEPDSYMPIGTMAVTSTLVVLGALGLLCIMWLGGPVNWWTTLPAVAFFLPLMLLLLLIPVLPLHRRLSEQREAATADAQRALREARSMNTSDGVAAQAAALTLRREVMRLPTWPFDVPAITRFISYAIIVPLTWAGAALIEMLVDSLVG